jgi:hypothetical protein
MRTEHLHLHLGSVGLDSDWFELSGNEGTASINNLTFHGPLHRLFQYLLESDYIVELEHEN